MPHLIEMTELPAGDDAPRHTFRIRHALADHPLMQLPRLVQLAADMPEHLVDMNSADDPNQDPDDVTRPDMSPAETVRRIEEAGTWLVIREIETDPAYGQLIDDLLDDIAIQSSGRMGLPMVRKAFLFVTSPGKVTPFHFDPEHGFLLQVRGGKTIHIFDQDDPDVMSDEQFEMFPGTHRNQPYDPAIEPKARSQRLRPGDGCYVPAFDPHWVKNDDEISISLSITYQTAESFSRFKLGYINAGLRKIGLPQARPGVHPLADRLKVGAYDALRVPYNTLRKMLGDPRRAKALIFGKKAAAV